MSAFEMMFTLLGLLLGLAIAEILGGLSRALRLSPHREAGQDRLADASARHLRDARSRPLLAGAWSVREQLLVDYPSLIGILIVAGLYYLAATLIFPDDPEEWPDYDPGMMGRTGWCSAA